MTYSNAKYDASKANKDFSYGITDEEWEIPSYQQFDYLFPQDDQDWRRKTDKDWREMAGVR